MLLVIPLIFGNYDFIFPSFVQYIIINYADFVKDGIQSLAGYLIYVTVSRLPQCLLSSVELTLKFLHYAYIDRHRIVYILTMK
jgi:hypothetical protein